MTENKHTQPENTQETQSASMSEHLADLSETMQREKIPLSPEMKAYLKQSVEAVQTKLMNREPIYPKDMEFVETIKDYIEKERFLKEFEPQYQKRLETGAYFELYDKNNPVVEGIDGKQHAAPTWAEIAQAITPEHLEKVKKYIVKPMLLVVPIAMPLEKIAQKVGAKKGKLPVQNKVEHSYELNADTSGDLVYFPDTYNKTSPGGISKADLLKQNGGFNKFHGWQVLIVDGDDEVQNATLNKSAKDLLAENKTFGITGMTPEEWLILHASGVQEKGKPFEEKNYSWCTSSYLKNRGAVPNCLWLSRDSSAFLDYDDPARHLDYIGGRRSVRIF